MISYLLISGRQNEKHSRPDEGENGKKNWQIWQNEPRSDAKRKRRAIVPRTLAKKLWQLKMRRMR